MKSKHLGPNSLTWGEYERTIADFNGLCAFCQERPYQELEHFHPRSKGGKTELANVLPVCKRCNVRKSNLTGDALIGAFGIATIERLRQYLELRSGMPVVIPNVESGPTYKKSATIRLTIREIASRQGMSQKALAEKSRVTQQLVNRYWNNKVQHVDLKELDKIAKALSVPPGDLIESIGENATKSFTKAS